MGVTGLGDWHDYNLLPSSTVPRNIACLPAPPHKAGAPGFCSGARDVLAPRCTSAEQPRLETTPHALLGLA